MNASPIQVCSGRYNTLAVRYSVTVKIARCVAAREDVRYHIYNVVNVYSTGTVDITEFEWLRRRSTKEDEPDKKHHVISHTFCQHGTGGPPAYAPSVYAGKQFSDTGGAFFLAASSRAFRSFSSSSLMRFCSSIYVFSTSFMIAKSARAPTLPFSTSKALAHSDTHASSLDGSSGHTKWSKLNSQTVLGGIPGSQPNITSGSACPCSLGGLK